MKKLFIFLNLIKFEHTIFALPFAYTGYILGSRGAINWYEVLWISVVMVAARTAGMGLNRLIDQKLDAENPRTAGRALVTGELTRAFVIGAVTVSGVVFFGATLLLKPICIKLLPAAFLLIVAYHYLKRFTPLCHFGIGLVLACAPVGGWLAASGMWEAGTVLIGAAMTLWVAGFDIFYSSQDEEADRALKVHSLVVFLGRPRAFLTAAICHLGTFAALTILGIIMNLGAVYWWGIWIVTGILIGEHALLARDPKRFVNTTFFVMNGFVSVVYFCAVFISIRRFS